MLAPHIARRLIILLPLAAAVGCAGQDPTCSEALSWSGSASPGWAMDANCTNEDSDGCWLVFKFQVADGVTSVPVSNAYLDVAATSPQTGVFNLDEFRDLAEMPSELPQETGSIADNEGTSYLYLFVTKDVLDDPESATVGLSVSSSCDSTDAIVDSALLGP